MINHQTRAGVDPITERHSFPRAPASCSIALIVALALGFGALGAIVPGRAQASSPDPYGKRDAKFSFRAENPFVVTGAGSFVVPALTDINMDGLTDLFVINIAGNILYYAGSGSSTNPLFSAPITNPFGLADVGAGAGMAFADVDHDGDLDALVAESLGPLYFFQNTGTLNAPAFAAPVVNPYGISPVGAYPTLAFADIDADGDQDLLLGNLAGDLVYYQNIGGLLAIYSAPMTSTFGLSGVPGGGSAPAFFDIDDDGDLDLFVGNASGETYLYRNAGNARVPAFSAPQINPAGLVNAGAGYAAPAFADYDHDGDTDAVLGRADGKIRVFVNGGPGRDPAFTLAGINGAGLSIGAAGRRLVTPAFADIDGDGDLDLFVGDLYENTIKYYQNTGSARVQSFSPPLTNALGLAPTANAATPAFVDIDGDGDQDAYSGGANGRVSFHRNVGSNTAPSFTLVLTNVFGATPLGGYSSPTFVDIDADNDQDAFVGYNETGKHIAFYRNTGTNTSPAFTFVFTSPYGLTSPGGSRLVHPAFADFDGDGDQDALITDLNGKAWFFRNRGTSAEPNFEPAVPDPFGLPEYSAAAPALADYNFDGDIDVILGVALGDIVFYQNNPAADPPFGGRQLVWSVDGGVSPFRPAFADIDGDGDQDLFLGTNSYAGLKYYVNNGNAVSPDFALAPTMFYWPIHTGDGAAPAFGDIDGDGDMDAFIGFSSGYTAFYSNTGTAKNPVFASYGLNLFGISNAGFTSPRPALADYDGDGDLDLFIGDDDGKTRLFKNFGSAASPYFELQLLAAPDIGDQAAPVFADLDADGDADEYIGGLSGALWVSRNTGSVSSPVLGADPVVVFSDTAVSSSAPAFADLDHDGDLDLFAGGASGYLVTYQNLLGARLVFAPVVSRGP